jgi:hypothetical protein
MHSEKRKEKKTSGSSALDLGSAGRDIKKELTFTSSLHNIHQSPKSKKNARISLPLPPQQHYATVHHAHTDTGYSSLH